MGPINKFTWIRIVVPFLFFLIFFGASIRALWDWRSSSFVLLFLGLLFWYGVFCSLLIYLCLNICTRISAFISVLFFIVASLGVASICFGPYLLFFFDRYGFNGFHDLAIHDVVLGVFSLQQILFAVSSVFCFLKKRGLDKLLAAIFVLFWTVLFLPGLLWLRIF